jgi:hypothetical protein
MDFEQTRDAGDQLIKSCLIIFEQKKETAHGIWVIDFEQTRETGDQLMRRYHYSFEQNREEPHMQKFALIFGNKRRILDFVPEKKTITTLEFGF